MELNKIYEGDSLEVLKTFEPESVDLIVTSPPYYGLRDYGVGAGQIGLEKTPQQYIQNLMKIFDECKRVLKKTGSLWVNIGDSYSTNTKGDSRNPEKQREKRRQEMDVNSQMSFGRHSEEWFRAQHQNNRVRKIETGLPEKSLIGIPERFVIAMTDSGWIRRNTVIWHKPNCMPSSAKDRFTVDFEYFYFFTKSKKYYFETQFEPFSDKPAGWRKDGRTAINGKGNGELSKRNRFGESNNGGRVKRTVWSITTKPYIKAHFAVFPEKLVETPIKACCPSQGIVLDPFMGSGTVGVIAKKLGHNFLGIELNKEYITMARNRIDSIL